MPLQTMALSSLFRVPRPVKSRLYHPAFYKQSAAKNVLLFSSRRGGSTLLEQIITCNRGFRSIDQPFDMFTPKTAAGKIKQAYLPPKEISQFVSLSDTEEAQVKNYVTLALSGQLRLLGGIETYDFPALGNRTFLKILNASPLIDWFSQNFDVYACYLTRHPIPQALSVMKNKWGITASAYLHDDTFVQRYLTPQQIALAENTLKTGDYFSQAILNWITENLVPLKHAKTQFPTVAYEHLVIQPEAIVSTLSKQLDLTDLDSMSKAVSRPSRSAKFSSASNQKMLKSDQKDSIISSWMKKITEPQRAVTQTLLDCFEISTYSADSYLPNTAIPEMTRNSTA